MAAGLSYEEDEKNLVVRAARALGAALGKALTFHLTLTKIFPWRLASAGDRQTRRRASLAVYWKLSPEAPILYQIAASMGQDVPCCLAAENCYFRGIGDVTEPAPSLPHTDIVLVNQIKRCRPLPSSRCAKARFKGVCAAGKTGRKRLRIYCLAPVI